MQLLSARLCIFMVAILRILVLKAIENREIDPPDESHGTKASTLSKRPRGESPTKENPAEPATLGFIRLQKLKKMTLMQGTTGKSKSKEAKMDDQRSDSGVRPWCSGDDKTGCQVASR